MRFAEGGHGRLYLLRAQTQFASKPGNLIRTADLSQNSVK
jgi:hypothetical protein